MKRALCILILCAFVGLVSGTAQSRAFEPGTLLRLVAEKSEPYILVDVRSPAEYSSGHIPTAVNIPAGVIAKEYPTEDKTALIIVYCASGSRSAAAKKTLDDLGYTNVADFGGIDHWTGELVASEPAPGAPTSVGGARGHGR